ncbi:MAG: hypothetical protein IT462_08180 [Planctomycetes bacterium]|nr:hypothetical protein [Planctomycetota bacterium]
MAACTQPALPEKPPEPVEDPITAELQSDLLELDGVQRWRSFYPNDWREFPEYFTGLDSDQRRRLRLAPRDGANKVLLKFDLPSGAKIWPVDWYGNECVAIDLGDRNDHTVNQYTVALADTWMGISEPNTNATQADAKRLATTRAAQLNKDGKWPFDKSDYQVEALDNGCWAVYIIRNDKKVRYAAYASRVLGAHSGLTVVVECRIGLEHYTITQPTTPYPDDVIVEKGIKAILDGITVARDLSLEGAPKHRCTSSVDDLKAGVLKFPHSTGSAQAGATLQLQLPDGITLRKTGSQSTIQVDGLGAQPLFLIRLLEEHKADGDLRARIRADSTFARRIQRPDASFGKGRTPDNAKLPLVIFDYRDNSMEQVALGVFAAGKHLFSFEVVGNGLRDGQKRRDARDKALEILAGMTGDASDADLSKLKDWKPGN